MGVYRLVGDVQIRQARVTNDSCLERRFLSDCINEVVNNATVCRPRSVWRAASCWHCVKRDCHSRSLCIAVLQCLFVCFRGGCRTICGLAQV